MCRSKEKYKVHDNSKARWKSTGPNNLGQDFISLLTLCPYVNILNFHQTTFSWEALLILMKCELRFMRGNLRISNIPQGRISEEFSAKGKFREQRGRIKSRALFILTSIYDKLVVSLALNSISFLQYHRDSENALLTEDQLQFLKTEFNFNGLL